MTALVYFLRAEHSGNIKIGCTGNLERRLATLAGASSEPVAVIGTVAGGTALEAHLHDLFAASRLRGEWFAATPDLVAYIDRVKRYGSACIPVGFTADTSLDRGVGRHTEAALVEEGRALAVRCRGALQRLGYSRMQAYGILARKSGTSVRWLRRLIGRQSDMSLPAHTYLNLRDLAVELEAQSTPEPIRRNLLSTA